MRMPKPALLAFALTVYAHGQSGPTLVTAGYTDLFPFSIAPGQVVTLFFTGLKTVLPSDGNGYYVAAGRTPLPTALQGISVTIKQAALGPDPVPLPLFSIEQRDNCRPRSNVPDCNATLITVQFPFDMDVVVPLGVPLRDPTVQISVIEDGSESRTFAAAPVNDQMHIVTSCDSIFRARGGGRCDIMIMHQDGGLVTPTRPARVGEILTIYALGLGRVSGSIRSGEPAATAIPRNGVAVGFDFRRDVRPANPTNSRLSSAPVFAGLVPGMIGLYQINFRVPHPGHNTQPCQPPEIPNNATVSIGGGASFDGAPLCVALE